MKRAFENLVVKGRCQLSFSHAAFHFRGSRRTASNLPYVKKLACFSSQKKSDPYFLTTVVFPSDGTIGEMTRLKLALFDVRNREKEEVRNITQ